MAAVKLEGALEIKQKSLAAVKWTYFQTLIPRFITPVTTIVLARLLSPVDFGLVAVATTTLSLLQIFQDFGMSKALIQSDENQQDVFNAVFWTNLARILILYALLVFAAPMIAMFFNNSSATPIVRILGLKLIFDAFGAVHRNALIRGIHFKRLFYVSMPSFLVPLCLTVPLAYLGYGVWSLVIGELASVFLSTLLLWTALSWRPTFHVNPDVTRRILVFGFWVTIEALAAWFYVQGDNAIVGRFFSTREFGVYVVSYNTVVMVMAIILAPLSSIAYPAFSRIRKDRALLASTLLDAIRLSALASLPAGVGMLLVARPAISILFGSKWSGMEFILGTLALAQALSWIVNVNPDAYRAVGSPDIVSKFQMAKLLYTVPAYLAAAQFSLPSFVYVKLAVVVVGVCLWFFLMFKTFPVTPRDLAEHLRTPFAATTGMALCVLGVDTLLKTSLDPPELLELTILVSTGIGVYIVLLLTLDKKLFRRLSRLVLASIESKKGPPA
ncbi:MAG: lipopolysaccharide biosynthesis protein [Deltaproteobacteria bacterium]|nr:lipopolysaccharide biosynthesis protein [Deltaproteobacteria bacterium]